MFPFLFFLTVTYPKISRFDGTPAFKFEQPVPAGNFILWDDNSEILWDDSSNIIWDN